MLDPEEWKQRAQQRPDDQSAGKQAGAPPLGRRATKACARPREARRLAGEMVLLVGGRICEKSPGQRFFSSPATQQAAAFVRGDLII